MLKEDLKNYIVKELERMGCVNIEFSNGKEGFMVVFFDCNNLISFRRETSGWNNSGIQLNIENEKEEEKGRGRKYKIEFNKI